MNTESVFGELVKIQSWPTVGLVFALVIIVGYCLRFWKSFPNEAIPTVVILVGAVGMILLSESRPLDVPYRIWNTKNFVVGLIIGFIAWMAHNLIISRLEDFLASKFDVISKLLGGKSNSDAPPPAPPTT